MSFREFILMSGSTELREFIVKQGCGLASDRSDVLRHMHTFHRTELYDAEIARLWGEYAGQTSAQVR